MKKVIFLSLVCIGIVGGRGAQDKTFAEEATMNSLTTQEASRNNESGTPGIVYSTDQKTVVNYEGTETDIVIPEGVTHIGESAFLLKKIKNVTFPSSLVSIESRAFSNNNLTSVIFPEGLESIGDSVFYKNNLTSVVFPNSLRAIGATAFFLNKLTSVTFPENMERIGQNSFRENNLTSVTIPTGIDRVEHGVFQKNNLASVTFLGELQDIQDYSFADNNLTSVILPEGLESIGKGAFSNNQLTNLTFPNSLKSIGNRAFSSNQLLSVTFSEGIKRIEDGAFSKNKLTSVVLPDSLEYYDEEEVGIVSLFTENQISYFKIPDNLNISRILLAGNQKISKEVDYKRSMVLSELGEVEYQYKGRSPVTVEEISTEGVTYQDGEFLIKEGVKEFSYNWAILENRGYGTTTVKLDYALFNEKTEAKKVINSLSHLTDKGKEVFNKRIDDAANKQDITDIVEEAKNINLLKFSDYVLITPDTSKRVLVNNNGSLRKTNFNMTIDWLVQGVSNKLDITFEIPKNQGSVFTGVKGLDSTHYTISDDGKTMHVVAGDSLTTLSLELDVTGDGELAIETSAIYTNELLGKEVIQNSILSNTIESVLVGDLNADGRITILDFALLKAYLNSGEYPKNIDKEVFDFTSDINGDSQVTIIDQALLKVLISQQD